MNIPKSKRAFEPDTYEQVKKLYMRDDNSTALLGKGDVKSIRKYPPIVSSDPASKCGIEIETA